MQHQIAAPIIDAFMCKKNKERCPHWLLEEAQPGVTKVGEELWIRSEGSSLEKVSWFVSAMFASWYWHFSIVSWEAAIVAQYCEKFKEVNISLLEHLKAEEEEEQEKQETGDLWTYEILYCLDVLLMNNAYAGQYKPS